MKNSYIILFLLISCISVSFSQGNWCGTPQDDAFMEDLIRNKKDWGKTLNKNSATRYVPITFHLVGKNDMGGRIGEEAVYKAVCTLNERYQTEEVDIVFYIKELSTSINRDDIYDITSNSSTGFLRSAKDREAMNIFVVNSISRSGGTGTTLGYYAPGAANDYIVIRKGNLGDAGYTLEHEIGHFFTLAHTHRGWEDLGWSPSDYDQKITFLEISSSQSQPVLVELVDRGVDGNCEIAGDFICDTPADYGRGFTCNCCVLNDVILDRNCDTLAPMMNNIMSYSGNCSSWEFTDGQATAMETSYDADNRLYLRQGNVDEFTLITDTISGHFPEHMGLHEVYDFVELKWNAVPNAEFYTVNVKGVEYTTTENKLLITDFSPNERFIFWGVKAFNKFGGACQVNSFQHFFDVGSEEGSAVNDIDFVEAVNIFPNPVSGNANISVSFDADKSFDADMRIYDITGKEVFAKRSISFSAGKNTKMLPINGLASGIHILEIRTNEGSITERLIIE